MSRTALGLGLLLALVLGAGLATEARGDEAPATRIPVRIVEGKLVVACDLSTPFRRIPTHLFVELETPCGLRLHDQAARGIRAENRDGTTNPITIHLPGLEIRVAAREKGPEDVYEAFTKDHSTELSETALVGTIGLGILKRYHLALDLAAGRMELAAPRPVDEEAGAPEEGTTTVVAALRDDLVWLPVRYDDGVPAVLAVGTAREDTLIGRTVAEKKGRPAGDIGPLRVGGIDLARYVAFRPEPVIWEHPDGVAGVTGLNLLRHLRVEIDRVNRVVRIRETAPADFPHADLAFFRARAESGGDPVEAFLREHEGARLAREAAPLLLNRRLSEGADDQVVHRAIRWVNDVWAEDRRATIMLGLLEQLSKAGFGDHAIVAGELGVESGREDRDPEAVHRIHGKLGEVLLGRKRGREAWRHLLSAAFGLPADGMINFNLGRYYEGEKRLRRAFSRYVQAVIQPESGPVALEGLKRVQEKLGGERFSVDLVERMIAGKVLSFGTAARYEPPAEGASNHVVLVEFFTNAHFEFAIGGALGNEGLLSHFPRKHVALLSYHLPAPELEPLVNEYALSVARARGVRDPTIHVVDGTVGAPGAGRSRDKEDIYQECRRAVLGALRSRTEHAITLEARVRDGVVTGKATVSGPARDGLEVHVVLAERGVLFPGKSRVVIHRHVARGTLTGRLTGLKYEPVAGKMEVPFERSLDDVKKDNEETLDFLEAQGAGRTIRLSTEIDPAQVTVVAYVRDASSRRILQAAQVDAILVEEADGEDER